MPFRLKNIGATYQRLVTGIFKDLIRTIVDVYVDDTAVKMLSLEDHLRDIDWVLDILDKIDMTINLEKCTFRVKAGKLLGYIVYEGG